MVSGARILTATPSALGSFSSCGAASSAAFSNAHVKSGPSSSADSAGKSSTTWPRSTACRRRVCSSAMSASSGSERAVPLRSCADPPTSTAASMLIRPRTSSVSSKVKPRRSGWPDRCCGADFTSCRCRLRCPASCRGPTRTGRSSRCSWYPGSGTGIPGSTGRAASARPWRPCKVRATCPTCLPAR